MENNINETTNEVYDYVFGVENKPSVRKIYHSLLDNPLFVEITEEDEKIILEKFTFIEDNNHEFPGFIFIKIDTSTLMVYVNYIPKRVLMDYKFEPA